MLIVMALIPPSPAAGAKLSRYCGEGCIRLGNKYGGYNIPEDILNDVLVAYSFGVGEDMSFDIALSSHCPKAQIYLFDPTPRARQHFMHVMNLSMPNISIPEDFSLERPVHALNFHFSAIGLSTRNRRKVKFYAPRDRNHVSHSIGNAQATDDFFEASTYKLTTIMQVNAHSRIDVLKLDIEGEEHVVLRQMAQFGIFPRVIAVELHGDRINTTTRFLSDVGYDLFRSDDNVATFKIRP